METPTTKQIRTWSKLDFDGLGFELPGAEGAEDPLDIQVARSVEYIQNVTGRALDTTMPPNFNLTAGEAVQRRTEQLAIKSQEDEAETAGDIDMISNFTAGSYSESRVDQTKQPGKGELKINPWPHLNKLLNMLMTEEKREYWEEVLNGVHAPYASISEVDWEGGDILDRMETDPFLHGA